MMSTKSARRLSPDPAVPDDASADRFDPTSPIWHVFLDEFRNHLSVLAAATSELGTDEPPAFAEEVGDAVFETERKVRGLTSLVALADASLGASAGSVEPIVAPLGAVVDRAIRLAAAAAGLPTSIVVSVPRAAGVKNRGAALEGLIALLIVDLAKAPAAPDDQACRAPRLRVDGDVGRRGLAIEVSCVGARLEPASHSWRLALAGELAKRLGATLTVAREVSTYVVQFALTSS
jgi:hypothetical protein